MRPWQYTFILATILAAGCGSRRPVPSESPSLTAAQTATVQANVRTFAQAVAHDVTQDGPGAWRKHFSQSPSFFMVVEGHMAFPNRESAQRRQSFWLATSAKKAKEISVACARLSRVMVRASPL